MKTIIFCLLTIISTQVFSQRIEKLTPVLSGEVIEITYDLIDNQQDRTFDLQLYSSHNDYSVPLQFVSGAIGEEISPGSDLKITWEAKKELGEYKGEIYLEVRGIFSPPFVQILSPSAGDKFKPGKNIEIKWLTKSSSTVSIDLYKGNTKVSSITKSGSSGSHQWVFSKKTAKGDNYHLLFGSSNSSKTIKSSDFTISKGLPIWMIIAGVAVVGGVVGVVTSGGEDPPGGPTTGPTGTSGDIPDPVKPGGS